MQVKKVAIKKLFSDNLFMSKEKRSPEGDLVKGLR